MTGLRSFVSVTWSSFQHFGTAVRRTNRIWMSSCIISFKRSSWTIEDWLKFKVKYRNNCQVRPILREYSSERLNGRDSLHDVWTWNSRNLDPMFQMRIGTFGSFTWSRLDSMPAKWSHRPELKMFDWIAQRKFCFLPMSKSNSCFASKHIYYSMHLIRTSLHIRHERWHVEVANGWQPWHSRPTIEDEETFGEKRRCSCLTIDEDRAFTLLSDKTRIKEDKTSFWWREVVE